VRPRGQRFPSSSEPGLDLHEWQTRWAELEDAFADAPDETLPEITRFLEEMLVERGYQLDEPVTVEGEDVVGEFLLLRDLAREVEAGQGEPEDIQTAFEGFRELYEYVVEDRAAP
jgi:hypothetical protein